MVLNLSIWFSLHTLFREVAEVPAWGLRLLWPDWHTLDLPAALIAGAAFVAIFRFKVGMIPTLLASAVCGLGVYLAFGT